MFADISGFNLWVLFCGGAMFGGGLVYFGLRYFQTPQVSVQRERELEKGLKDEQLNGQEVGELETELENERRKQQEVEVQIETLQVAVQRERELERRLKDEQLRRQEVEERLNLVQNIQAKRQRELERQLENERRKRQEVEVQIETLQVAVQRERELETRLKDEQLRRQQEVEERLKLVQNIQGKRQRELERQLENERRKRQEAEVQRQGVVKSQQGKSQSSVDVSLVSAKGVDYTKLRDLLAAGKWKEADEETERVMLKVVGRESEGWLDIEDIENFPCQDLGTIDKLWVKYSNGKFGFSVQKQIYQSLGGTNKYNREVWEAFGDKVGWRQGGAWLGTIDLTFDISRQRSGHLPMMCGFRGWWVLFSRTGNCRI